MCYNKQMKDKDLFKPLAKLGKCIELAREGHNGDVLRELQEWNDVRPRRNRKDSKTNKGIAKR